MLNVPDGWIHELFKSAEYDLLAKEATLKDVEFLVKDLHSRMQRYLRERNSMEDAYERVCKENRSLRAQIHGTTARYYSDGVIGWQSRR